LIRQTRDLLSNSRHDEYGAQLGRWLEGSLNIRVSKASVRRALLIMDALLNALMKEGFEINVIERSTYVSINGTRIELELTEKFKRFENDLSAVPSKKRWQHDRYYYEAQGELSMRAVRRPFNLRTWRDGLKGKLESKLTSIVIELIESAELLRQEHERRQSETAAREELRRLEDEKRKRLLREKKRRRELWRMARNWQRSIVTQQFIRACERELLRDSPNYQKMLRVNGCKWAYQQIEKVDPIKNGVPNDHLIALPDL